MENKIYSGFKVQNGIITCPAMDIPNVKGLGITFFQKMKEHKKAVAQLDGISGRKDTYDQYLKRCIRTALTMRAKGITSNEIISICSFNNMDVTVPYIAALFLGAKIACLDPTLTLSVAVHILSQVRPKMIFVGPEAIKLIEEAILESDIDTTIVVFGESAEHFQFSECLLPFFDENDFVPVEVANIKDTALILFSSGTTGFPKGICINHYGLLGPRTSVGQVSMSVSLSFGSIYWISATLILLTCVMDGTARVVYPKFNADIVWFLIEKFKVTTLFLVPTQLISICRNTKPKNVDLSSLQYVFTGGSAISKDILLEARNVLKGSLISNIYGMTELSGLTLSLNYLTDPVEMELFLRKPDTLGRPMNGFSYKVVHPDTEEVLGPNQSGELRIKTEFQMNGYYNLDSSGAWDSEGFLKTGDIVYYEKDYSFFYVDRITEILKYRTYTVVPAKLEAILLSYPAVEYAVVFGMPHPEDGDLPTGVVVLAKSVGDNVRPKDIEKYVEKRVSEVEKLRGGVRIANTIYITPTGKLSRRRMKDLVLRGEI